MTNNNIPCVLNRLAHKSTWCFLLCALLTTGLSAVDRAPGFFNYRDLKVYTTSAPDKANPAKIIVHTQFVNEGKTELKISARLNTTEALTIRGGKFSGSIKPGKDAVWTWSFIAPADLKREVLTGEIILNGRPERDLYIAVQGTDPADYLDKEVELITDRAQVIATYAPRKQNSILAEKQYLAAHRPKPVLTLAAAGKTDYAIVVEAPAAAPKELADAIADLQRSIKAQSDADLPLAEEQAGPAIRLRQIDLGEAAKGLQDAYRLRTAGKDVIIEAGNTAGLCFGIYGLLTDHLDCHWFQPKHVGEEIVIPRDKTVRLPALDEVQGSPWFSATGVSWSQDRAWDYRNRAYINNGRMNFGHSWYGYINNNEYPYDKFPEYYARDRQGKVRNFDNSYGHTNFCSTNPDVIEIVAKKVNAQFAGSKETIVVSIDPNDASPMCLCDRCLALDKSYGVTQEDGNYVTDRLLHFSKEIYDRLDPAYKDRYLGILIYADEVELPKTIKPHLQHAGMICNMPWDYDHSRPWNDPTSPRNRHFYNLIKGWGKLITQFGYYDYYGHYSYYGPWGMVHTMREELPAFRDLGGTYLMLEMQPNYAAQGLNHYIAGRLVWDADADVDLLMEEFFEKYYGPAAGPMRDYWLAHERWFALERPAPNNTPRVAFRPEFWSELDVHLQRARAIAAALPPDQQRYADRVQQAGDGFDYGRLVFAYWLQYGKVARKLRLPVDHAAAITFLQANKTRLAEWQGKYSRESTYWPTLLPSYFHIDFDAWIHGHEKALQE